MKTFAAASLAAATLAAAAPQQWGPNGQSGAPSEYASLYSDIAYVLHYYTAKSYLLMPSQIVHERSRHLFMAHSKLRMGQHNQRPPSALPAHQLRLPDHRCTIWLGQRGQPMADGYERWTVEQQW